MLRNAILVVLVVALSGCATLKTIGEIAEIVDEVTSHPTRGEVKAQIAALESKRDDVTPGSHEDKKLMAEIDRLRKELGE